MSNIERYRTELRELVEVGNELLKLISKRDENGNIVPNESGTSFWEQYHGWYTQAYVIVKHLIPDRLEEFEQLYKGDGRRTRVDQSNYSIQDWLNGVLAGHDQFGNVAFDRTLQMGRRFINQRFILASAEMRLDKVIFEIRQFVQADLLDSEIDSAREFMVNGFMREAGRTAGVALEKHLKQVVDNHNIQILKKNPSIGELNDLLKNDNILDIPSWRQIQWFADIRNICAHDRDREPTKEEIDELINGVDRYTKTLF